MLSCSLGARPALLCSLALLTATHAVAGAQARDTSVINRSSNALLSEFRFRELGPASMGGRVDDVEVAPSKPSLIYLGLATGGLWKSENNATTFEPVFETYGSASIGDIAIHPTNPDIVYVGTGEPNNRNSSSFGDGLYKTVDGGKTFTRIGLNTTQTIARIVIDPRKPDIIYVAVPGHLFGPDTARGIYKTTNAGATWDRIKFIDENTGFTDIVIDPSNSKVLYAASYQRRRTGCCYNGGGPGSGVWKTEDAGKTWNRLTGNGLPPGTYGRIALDIARSNPNVVYAQIETGLLDAPAAAPPAVPVATDSAAATAGRGAGGAGGAGGAAGGAGGGRGGGGGADPCNNAVTPGARGGRGPAGGAAPAPPDPTRSGVYRSNNKGKSWTVVSNCDGRPLYFSQLRVDPSDENTVFVANVQEARSTDGGKTFRTLSPNTAGAPYNMTEDQHALWIDPQNGKHLLRGSDAGLAISWDQGANWEYVRTIAAGQSYWVTADMGHPYFVYTGMQDNDSWGGPTLTRSRNGITAADWFHLTGGDGFQTAVDPTDFHIVYSESQEGNVSRIDLRTGRSQSIRPVPPSGAARPAVCGDGGRGGGGGGGRGGGGQGTVTNGEPGEAYRFNWNTPILLSPHNPSTVWIGGNRLFKSLNRGDAWTQSPDLTKRIDRCEIALMGVAGNRPQISKNDGVTSYGTIISISESPMQAGVVWAGTDDGNLQVSRDGGTTFTEVGKNLPGLPAGALDKPGPYWISRIDASHFEAGTAYVSVDGHRSDDLTPYVFVTRDYGRTFASVSGNLPRYGNVQVIREDPKNRDLLYVGTEFGLFVSLDAGNRWERFMNGYPTVRTDDILIHPRDGDLVVATHGRSLWMVDDITALQQLTPAVAAQDVTLFDVRPAINYLFDFRRDQDIGGERIYTAPNPPRGTAVSYYLKSAVTGDVTLSILDPTGRVMCTNAVSATAGIHRMQWTLVGQAGGGAGGRGGGGAGAGGAGGAGGRGGAGGAAAASCNGGAGGRGGGAPGAAAITAGTYTAKLTVAGKDYTKPVMVLDDIWLHER